MPQRLIQCQTMGSEIAHDYLLLHRDVSQMNKRKAVERFTELEDDFTLRQSKWKWAGDHVHIMQNRVYMCNVALLAEIFFHLNALSLQPRGRETARGGDAGEARRPVGTHLIYYMQICYRGGCCTPTHWRQWVWATSQKSITQLREDFLWQIWWLNHFHGTELPLNLCRWLSVMRAELIDVKTLRKMKTALVLVLVPKTSVHWGHLHFYIQICILKNEPDQDPSIQETS